MKEISEKEYDDLVLHYEEEAAGLALKDGNNDEARYFSSHHQTCVYDTCKTPKSFNVIKKKSDIDLKHFLDTPCNEVKLSCKKTAMCICEDESDINNPRYFKTTHLVGKCPWKKRKGE